MKYHEMTKNQIFREFNCGLTIEEVAKICCKSLGTVRGWDKGKPIPNECRKLMKMHKRLELSGFEEWNGFRVSGKNLELPTGETVTPQQILTGVALLHIQSDLEIKTSKRLLRLSRAICNIKSKANG
ncbi:phage protein [Vibrio mexicanus]|uniref:phage protein n=1 Tax=Vibrio mexicanus TaxID=1004326 RepID=UPI00063C79EA|nr:phage protein [Vibrio mexicanus]